MARGTITYVLNPLRGTAKPAGEKGFPASCGCGCGCGPWAVLVAIRHMRRQVWPQGELGFATAKASQPVT
jgi:hypothetical protein